QGDRPGEPGGTPQPHAGHRREPTNLTPTPGRGGRGRRNRWCLPGSSLLGGGRNPGRPESDDRGPGPRANSTGCPAGCERTAAREGEGPAAPPEKSHARDPVAEEVGREPVPQPADCPL